jgi:hypothetical protein
VAWTLFIDESGDLHTPGSTGVVAGLLLPGTDRGPLHTSVRKRLTDIFAGLRWPPRASTLNIPLAALQGLGELKPAQRPPELESVRRALGPLGERLPEADWQQLRTLDLEVAERHPEEHRRLIQQRQLREARMHQLLADLAGLGGDRPQAFLAFAEVDPSADDAPAGEPVVHDSYVRLLIELLSRVQGRLLHGERGVELVEAVVADRDLRLAGSPSAGAPMTVPLMPRYLEGFVRQAHQHTLGAVGAQASSVRIVATGRRRYRGEDTPAGLVIADWLANRGARRLREAPPRTRIWEGLPPWSAR